MMGKKPAAKAQEDAKKATKHDDKKVEAKAKKKATVKVEASSEGCKIKGCKREYRAKGYCVAHYRKWRQGEYGVARYKTCSSMDCRKPAVLNKHGLCEEHFQSYYVKGEKAAVAAPAEKPAEKAADKTNAA